MAVTKQTYLINAGFSSADVATALRSALIDAGLMAEWYDSFTININTGTICRVLAIAYDATKTYGTSFYYFVITNSWIGVALATGGWKTSGTAPINIPTGTQYLDWHTLPENVTTGGASNFGATPIFNYSSTSNLSVIRFTSANDPKQSWFLFNQSSTVTKSRPFSFLHKDTALHPWLDLSKGCISGFAQVRASVENRTGFVGFRLEENLQRCLSVGAALRGATVGSSQYHGIGLYFYSYFGVGAQSNAFTSNMPISTMDAYSGRAAIVPLPVGKNSANPNYAVDYVPICSVIPWSYYTPTLLASDFGVYMHYASNDVALGDRFVVQFAINEWEVLDFANNANVNDGASASFLARII